MFKLGVLFILAAIVVFAQVIPSWKQVYKAEVTLFIPLSEYSLSRGEQHGGRMSGLQ